MENQITTKEVYDLVEKVRIELTSHVLRLEGKFDTLEAGRLSAIEKSSAEDRARFMTAIAELRAEGKPVKMIVYGMVSLILVAVASAVIYLVVMPT